MKIKLKELADALAISETHTGYLDLEQGKILLTSSLSEHASDEEEAEKEEKQMEQSIMWENDWQRYVVLPNLGDYDFREQLHKFIVSDSLSDKQRKELEEAFSRRAPEPFYKKMLKDMNLLAEWELFLNQYFIAVARDWCDENCIDYEE